MSTLTRNLAISNVKTVGDLRLINYICEGVFYTPADLQNNSPLSLLHQDLVVYDNRDCSLFMHHWSRQEYSHCTLMTMEEFRRKYGAKRLQTKRRQYAGS
jgi:hypothetical protein